MVEKAGGPFRLAVLIPKRLKELKTATFKTGNNKLENFIDLIYVEILQEKITLAADEEERRSPDMMQEIFKNDSAEEKV
jgi:hypothetical protein